MRQVRLDKIDRRILRDLHLYDTEAGFYSDFQGAAVPARKHTETGNS